MGLLDQAIERANEATRQRAERAASIEQTGRANSRAALARITGCDVVDAGDSVVAGWASQRVDGDIAGFRRYYPPQEVRVAVFAIDDIRIARSVGIGFRTAEWALLRPCPTCSRTSVTELNLSDPDAFHTTKSQPVEERREKFLTVLTRAVGDAPECSFCKLEDGQATCPTCHRRWDQ